MSPVENTLSEILLMYVKPLVPGVFYINSMDTNKKVESFIADKRSDPDRFGKDKVLLPGTLPFVTIASQSGAGGHELSESLIKQINHDQSGHHALRGWRVFDKSMCQQLIDEEHLADAMNELLDENYHSQITEFVRGLYGDRGMQNVAYVRLSKLLCTVAAVGKVIILGHGGSLATKGMAGGTHVRLVAPLPTRASRMAHMLNITEAEASHKIQNRDREQRKLLKTHYHEDSANPEHYDLVCNTERTAPGTVADLVVTLLHKRLEI